MADKLQETPAVQRECTSFDLTWHWIGDFTGLFDDSELEFRKKVEHICRLQIKEQANVVSFLFNISSRENSKEPTKINEPRDFILHYFNHTILSWFLRASELQCLKWSFYRRSFAWNQKSSSESSFALSIPLKRTLR